MELQGLLTIVLGMAGFGALVSAIVNLLKGAGVVTDGTSQTWVTGLNLVGVVALFVAQTVGVQLDMTALDANLGTVATILVSVGQLVVAMGGSKLFYSVSRGSPVVGKSYSK
jgi:uncharacterized membrane protein